MPKKDPFTSGRTGKYSPIMQASFGAKVAFGTLVPFEPELIKPVSEIMVGCEDKKNRVSSRELFGMNDAKDVAVVSAFKDPEDQKKAREFLVNVRNKFDEYSKDPKWAPYKGMLGLMKNTVDPDKGPFLDALRDTPYLLSFRNSLLSSPTLTQDNFEERTKKLSDQVDPVTGAVKEGPLKYIDAFYGSMTPLFDLEYEKQNLKPGDQAAEQDLLNRMHDAFGKTINAYEDLYAFTAQHIDPQTGKTEYDSYLNNGLDHFTNYRKGVGFRGQFNAIGHLKGQQKAIENGWKLGELEILGSVGKMEAELATTAHDLELSIKYPADNSDEKGLAESREKLERLREFSQKFNKFKNEVYSEKANNDAQKLKITEKIENFYEENADVINEFDSLDEHQRFIGRSKEIIRNRTLKKEEIPENVFDQSYYDDLKEYYVVAQGSYNLKTAIDAADPVLGTDIFSPEENTENIKYHTNEFGTDMTGVIESFTKAEEGTMEMVAPMQYSGGPVYRYSELPDERTVKQLGKWSEQMHEALDNFTHNLDEDVRFAAPMYRFMNTAADTKNGNYMQAVAENPFLAGLYSQLGAGPNLYIDKNEKKYLPHKKIRDDMTEMGVLPHLMDFYEGCRDLAEAEYEKQRAMKSGWNDKAEKRYLTRLDKAYSDIISAYDKLYALPDDVQKNDAYMGNPIGHITGKFQGTNERDFMSGIEGMKWTQQAIKNGWPSQYIDTYATFGMFCGNINRKKLTLKEAIDHPGENATEESIARNKEDLAKLEEWEKENLDPMKERLFNRKYQGPETAHDTIRQINEFKEAHLNSENENVRLAVDSYLKAVTNRYKQMSNAAVDEIRNTPSRYYQLDGRKNFAEEAAEAAPEAGIPAPPKKSDMLMQQLRSVKEGKTLTEEGMKKFVSGYIKERFLESLSDQIDPQFFNTKNRLYNDTQKYLESECDKYTNQCLNGVNAKDPKKLADYLEYGSHQTYFRDIYQKTKAHVAKSCFDSFISERTLKPNESVPENENLGDMMERLEKQMLDKRPKSFDDAQKGLNEATAVMGKSLYSGVKSNFGKIIETKRKFEKELRKNQLDKGVFTVKDRSKLEKFAKLEDETLKQMDKYIAEKEEKLRKNERLGKNGTARLKAMKEARKTLAESAKVTKALLNNELTPELYKYIQYDSYKVDTNGLETESVVRSQKAAEERLQKDVKNLTASKPEDILNKENEFRKGLKADDPDYYDKLMNSAMRTIYTTSLANSKIKLTDEFTKENSPWFTNFKNKINENPGVKMAFESSVSSAAANGRLDTQDILKARDDTFRELLTTYKDTMMNSGKGVAFQMLEEVKSVDRLAKVTGSTETVEKLNVPNNERQLEFAKKNAARNNNLAM